jgi:AcrR family transcriptional regulator
MTEMNFEQFKYKRHSEKQYALILSVAEKLFTEKGIENVNLSDIAKECGIMRSTFYRYFTNKDDLLWHILHGIFASFTQKFIDRFEETNGTTFDCFKSFLDTLYEDYLENPRKFLFFDLMSNDYQTVTSTKDNPIYNRYFMTDEFRTGDTIKLLVKNFHDGSVKSDLDPQTTAVSITYGAWSIVTSMSKQMSTLPSKYGIETKEVVRINLNALLDSLKVHK